MTRGQKIFWGIVVVLGVIAMCSGAVASMAMGISN
jgi:hypothetical protein